MTKDLRDLVHVNSYVKDDGTQVREHYRGAPGSGETPVDIAMELQTQDNSGQDALQSQSSNIDETIIPRIQIEDYPYSDEEYSSEAVPDAQVVQGHVEYTEQDRVQIEKAIDNANSEIIKAINAEIPDYLGNLPTSIGNSSKMETKEKIGREVDKIKKVFQKSEEAENKLLDTMTSVKDQEQYQKYYSAYMNLHESNKKLKQQLNRIEYTYENEKYDLLLDELENFKSDFFEVVQKNMENRPLKYHEIISNTPLKRIGRFAYRYTDRHNLSTPIKLAIQGLFEGADILSGGGLHNTAQMWKASARDFLYSSKYVLENGSLVYRVADLPDAELQSLVSRKLASQHLEPQETIGMIAKSYGPLAKLVAGSNEIHDLYIKHKDELFSNRVVKGESVNFSSNGDLQLALGHADIIYMYIDDNEDLCSLALDTYDMNEKDPDFKVRFVAKYIQKPGAMRNYYTLIISKTPKSIWQNWK